MDLLEFYENTIEDVALHSAGPRPLCAAGVIAACRHAQDPYTKERYKMDTYMDAIMSSLYYATDFLAFLVARDDEPDY